jgi:hypothetical protein
MATEFKHSIQTDFLNKAVDASVLTVEIERSSITPRLNGITINGDVVAIEFDTDLSDDEVKTLGLIVAAHQGIPFNDGPQRVNVVAVQDNATTSYVVAATLKADPISTLNYSLSFYCELRTLTGVTDASSQFSLLLDGSEVASGGVESFEFFDARSGALVISATTRGVSPVVELQFRRNGPVDTAQIRRIRLALVPLVEEDT